MKRAFVIVDVQNDFCPGGLFPVPKGDEVVEPINRVLKYAREKDWLLVASRDWHPEETKTIPNWDVHCVQNTQGAEYHPDLNIQDDVTIISKGEDLSDKHYSAFNGDDITLDELLKKNGVEEVYIAGLATDYCVQQTVLDSLERGYKTFVIKDGCRAIANEPEQVEQTFKEMHEAGAVVTTSREAIQQ